MRLAYGHASIIANGREYSLVPSLVNIAKLGDPKEIINTVKSLYTDHFTTDSFLCAVQLLNACGLPQTVTGGWAYSERQKRVLISPGKLPIEDVYTLAQHVVRHGISGLTDGDQAGEPMREFNPHKFITLAMAYLNLSLSEAENLTMSHMVMLLEAKHKDAEKPDQVPSDESEAGDMMEWYKTKAEALKMKHGVH